MALDGFSILDWAGSLFSYIHYISYCSPRIATITVGFLVLSSLIMSLDNSSMLGWASKSIMWTTLEFVGLTAIVVGGLSFLVLYAPTSFIEPRIPFCPRDFMNLDTRLFRPNSRMPGAWTAGDDNLLSGCAYSHEARTRWEAEPEPSASKLRQMLVDARLGFSVHKIS